MKSTFIEVVPSFDEQEHMLLQEIKKLRRINRILCPHKYQNEKDVFGRNDLTNIVVKLDADPQKWPKLPALIYDNDLSENSPVPAAYRAMSDQMAKNYAKTLIDKNIMLSYKDAVENSNLIDITNIYSSKDKLSHPDISFSEESHQFLKSHSWYAFCPCFISFTVKTNRKHYTHIELLEINEQDKTFTVKVSEYIGDKYEWIIHSKAKIKYSFEENDGTADMSYDISDVMTYEEILTCAIKDCKWSKQQIKFWFDLFSINYIDKSIRTEITFPEDFTKKYGSDDDPVEFIFYDSEDLQFAQKNFELNIKILEKGNDVLKLLHERITKIIIKAYLHTSAAVNLKLFTEPRIDTGETDNGRNIYKFKDMIVKSTSYPVVPNENRLIKLRPRKDESK